MSTTKPYKVLCMIPMRNCESTIAQCLSHFQGEILSYIREILVIDNLSEDQSLAVAAKELSKMITVKSTLIQNTRNYGLGGSHKMAFKYAYENGYDFLLVVHGDGSGDVSDFLPVFKAGLAPFEMLLSDRLSSLKPRKNFSTLRFLGNKCLCLLASLATVSLVKDFTGGPINLYRVSRFFNKYENAVKNFSNDVSFSQFAFLYGRYRKGEFLFVPITHKERDQKSFPQMFIQFAKATLLLVKFFFRPEKTIAQNIDGPYLGHTFKKIKFSEVGNIQKPVVRKVKKLILPADAPLLELKKFGDIDPFLQNYVSIDPRNLSAGDLLDSSFLWIVLQLDIETVTSYALKSFFLELFKVYPPKRIKLDIDAEEVLGTKQLKDFLEFCQRFNLDYQIESFGSGGKHLWRNHKDHLKKVTLNFDLDIAQREDFVSVIEELESKVEVRVNVQSHPDQFYYTYGLFKKLSTNKNIKELNFVGYSSLKIPEDHLLVLSQIQKNVAGHSLQSDFPTRKVVIRSNGEIEVDSKIKGSIFHGFRGLHE